MVRQRKFPIALKIKILEDYLSVQKDISELMDDLAVRSSVIMIEVKI